MRLDYILYAVAIIFFIVTLTAAVYSFEPRPVWVVTTAVIGLAAIGLGYGQRPKPTAAAPATANIPPPPTPPPQEQKEQPVEPQAMAITTAPPQPQPIVTVTAPAQTEAAMIEEAKPIAQPPQPTQAAGLTEVKGIGEKRAAQLKAIGVSTIEDLAKASAKDLATKLNISPKITTKWIENAKEITARI
jgi:predicted flap endonuclease-1-like 5' DNA nuclease